MEAAALDRAVKGVGVGYIVDVRSKGVALRDSDVVPVAGVGFVAALPCDTAGIQIRDHLINVLVAMGVFAAFCIVGALAVMLVGRRG